VLETKIVRTCGLGWPSGHEKTVLTWTCTHGPHAGHFVSEMVLVKSVD
jgi:hypothetical protein